MKLVSLLGLATSTSRWEGSVANCSSGQMLRIRAVFSSGGRPVACLGIAHAPFSVSLSYEEEKSTNLETIFARQ